MVGEPVGQVGSRSGQSVGVGALGVVVSVASGENVLSSSAVMHAWEKALAAHDLEGLLACYAPDAALESPVVAHIITGGVGIRRGHDELRGGQNDRPACPSMSSVNATVPGHTVTIEPAA